MKVKRKIILNLFVGVYFLSEFLVCCNGTMGAFCRNDKSTNAPRDLYLPWIWDAVYVDLAQNNRYVEITAVAPSPTMDACYYNHSQWVTDTRHHIAAKTTMTKVEKQQGMVDVENAIVLVGERLKCEFLDSNDKLLYVSWSDVIMGNPTLLG